MKAFVTGSTGLLGSNLVTALLAAGYEVKALVRSRSKGEKLFGKTAGVSLVIGDMEQIADFAPEMKGCDVLFHTAAYFREYYGSGNHWPTLEKINIRGTVRLLELAEAAGIKKAIYVSSSGVIGMPKSGTIADETVPPDEYVYSNLYFKSKVLAERAVDDFLKTHQLPVVFILPTWMYGPGDGAPTTAGQLVQDFMARKLAAIPPGGNMIVDARDVANAMVAAVACGRGGERYIVGGSGYTMNDLCVALEKVSGVRKPGMRLSPGVFLAFARFSEAMARLRGSETLVTVEGARSLLHHVPLTSAKAIQELGATFRPLEETLRDEVAWYRARA